jgi:LIVCS family branched-chain amino acid:cation transporter
MLFGAGNVVFPLALGRESGSTVGWAVTGFCLTAVLVPLLGLVSTVLYDGDYRKFLGRVGVVPGSIIAAICMILIGPFGAIPRCMNTAYAASKWYFPDFSLFYFSIMAALTIFLFALRRNGVVDLIGKFLGPLKLTLLLSIIVIGIFWVHGSPTQVDMTPTNALLKGVVEGYGTMDLLATIFFAGLIMSSLKKCLGPDTSYQRLAWEGLKAGIVGAILLGVVYAGFCLVAAFHGPSVADVSRYELLNALAPYILGPHGGMLTNATVAVSCLVTALALTTVFAEYLRKSIFKSQLSYLSCLMITTIASGAMANLGFATLMSLIMPVIAACYPALIMLSIVNIAHKLFGFKFVKAPVFATLLVTVITMVV